MTLYVVPLPDPPAGQDFQYVVPGNYLYDVTGITATLQSQVNVLPIVAQDASGNNHDGTYTFNRAASPFVAGLVSGDLSIDFGQGGAGGSVLVSVPFGGIDWAANWSIELWIENTRGVNGGGAGVICSTGGLDPKIRVLNANGIHPRISVGDGIGFLVNGPLNSPPGDANPHHIVATSTAGTVKIYVDGVAVATTVSGTPPASPAIDTTNIGSSLPPLTNTATVYDEVAIYNTALSAARVAAHHTAGLAGFATYVPAVLADTPLMFFHLDENTERTGRQPTLTVSDGTTEVEAIPSGFPAVLTPGPYVYAWQPALNADTQSSDGTLTTVAVPELLLPPGYRVGSRTLDLQPGDQWSQVNLWWDDAYQRAIDPVNAYAFPGPVKLIYQQNGAP